MLFHFAFPPFVDQLLLFAKRLHRPHLPDLSLNGTFDDTCHQIFLQENEDNEHRGTFIQLFDGSQMKMFEAIINATKIAMKNHPDLEFVIPLGTAVQNFRTSKFGDEGPWILRDDIGHLSRDLGYYLGALMAAKCISDLDVSALKFIPPDYAESFADPALVEGLKAAVQGAFDNPWQVTENPYK